MTPPIHVHFEESRDADGLVRRLVFDGLDGPDGPRAETWWRLADATDLPPPPVLDSLVCGHVLWAAMRGQDLVVHGPMTAGGLRNMAELVELRHAFSPERYRRPIRVEAAQIVEPPRASGGVVAALSGGLDSTFTAVRHARILPPELALRPSALVMVLGFDAPLDRPDRFDLMRSRAEPLARWLGLPIHTVATNAAITGGRAWPHAAIPLFGSVLAQFSARFGTGLVSAGAPHGTPRFGVSHPALLDALVGNDHFRVVSDGGGFGRTDKIEALKPFPVALAAIKVCWQGRDPARNCGRCEKCVMTRLNFLAAGIPDPPCFDDPLTPEHVAALPMPSVHAARDLFRTCWNELEARGCDGPVVDLLRRRLARVPPDRTLAALRRLGGIARRAVPAPVRHAIHRRLPATLRPS